MEFLSALVFLPFKWPVLISLVLASIYLYLRNVRTTHAAADKFFSNFKVGGHRGSPRCQPENTIASMSQAKLEGADLIEFDVSLTKDGIAVLLHDETLDRTTNMTGAIRDFLFKDLDSCNCAAKFKPIGLEINNNEATILPMTTLEQLVQWGKANNMRMLFDVKDADASLVLTLEYLFNKYNIYDTGIVCSFFPTVVYWIKRQQPQILTGITWRRWFFAYSDLEATIPRFKGTRLLFAKFVDVIYMWSVQTWLPGFLGVDMMLTEREDISANFVKQQQLASRRVCAWTVNDLNEMRWMHNTLNIPFLTDVAGLACKL